jgi:SAM-dependent methyltransferase
MSTLPNRRPYQGVLQILRFNATKYLAAAAGILTAALVWPLLPSWGRIALALGIAPLAFWLVSSLIVSHYVYDRFPLYDFRPIGAQLARVPRRWINIHSGFDETSERLAEAFPGSRGDVVDIFDVRLMTERSIRQAQRMNRSAMAAIPGRYDELPFGSESFDAAFAIFAAHELRRHKQRVRLFGEIARVLNSSGELLLMEHVRDWRNFLAFGPGYLHFFSQRAWQSAAVEAGLNLEKEFTRTPFVRVYVFRRAQ